MSLNLLQINFTLLELSGYCAQICYKLGQIWAVIVNLIDNIKTGIIYILLVKLNMSVVVSEIILPIFIHRQC